jgi:dipeptidyl aminopeptidase/acylaminoacyl peptidase
LFASDFSQIPDAHYSWGAPWNDPLTYRRQSPFYYVTRVHTPLLLIHSDDDIRTPVDQTYEEYTALKALGKDVELVEFPRENHDLSRTGEPLHRIERLHLLADYFTRMLPASR